MLRRASVGQRRTGSETLPLPGQRWRLSKVQRIFCQFGSGSPENRQCTLCIPSRNNEAATRRGAQKPYCAEGWDERCEGYHFRGKTGVRSTDNISICTYPNRKTRIYKGDTIKHLENFNPPSSENSKNLCVCRISLRGWFRNLAMS